MLRSTGQHFTDTASGRAFFRAYDDVLKKWPEGTAVRDLQSRFGTTRLTVYGRENAPPVVLLPGGGATSTVWFANAAAIGVTHRVCAVDFIGDVGRSIASGEPIRTVDDLLEWLKGVVDAVGTERPSIVAHSYGAMVALAYALRAQVDKLVLLDPNSCFAGMKPNYLLHALPILLRPNESRGRSFLRWETGGALLDADWVKLMALGAAHFPTTKTVVPARPGVDALAKLAADVTVVLAPRSKVHDSVRVASLAQKVLPAARVITLSDGTHHCLPLEPLGEVNAALREALDPNPKV